MESARLIREARRRAGLTQIALAQRLDTTQSVIARWERGTVQPSLETARRALRACGFDLDVALVPVDNERDAQLDRNLALTPAQRLDKLVRTARFLQTGRRALARS
jgi:transcriptional regulator with XRE-family HTH domain